MELTKLKIKSARKLYTTKVHDLTVADTQHYFTENGVVNHNTGPEYAASIILFLTKAKLTVKKKVDGKKVSEQTGIIVTAKPNKNRFAKPTSIKFQIPFNKGMNAFVGLEKYVSWETCGIEKGYIYSEKEYSKLKEKDQIGLIPFEYINTETGEIEQTYFEPSDSSNKIIVKHLGRAIDTNEFFTSSVFTKEVLEAIDEKVQPLFNYGIHETSIDDFDIDSDDIDENEEGE
jgi:hypothetical protein